MDNESWLGRMNKKGKRTPAKLIYEGGGAFCVKNLVMS